MSLKPRFLYFFVLPFLALVQCRQTSHEEIVSIPDQRFLKALVDLGVEKNGDGLISYPEAEATFSISLSPSSISDLSGLEAFMYLDCSGGAAMSNTLTYLDLSMNPDLEILDCARNRLTGLDVSGNADIVILGVDNMPTIYEVCVWTTPFPPPGVIVLSDYSPNVYFTNHYQD